MRFNLTFLAAATFLAGAAAAAHAQELVQNGGFETGSFAGWTEFGDVSFNGTWQGGPPYPHSGVYSAYFGPASTGGILQALGANFGDQVHVSFWYVSENGLTDNSIAVALGSVQVFSAQDVTATTWQHVSADLTVLDPSPVLRFTFHDAFDAIDLDDVSVTVTGHGGSTCGSADFNCDGDTGTDADIEAFFACLAGTCPAPPCNSSADFNGDGDFGTDADIEAFFRVLAGGPC